MTKQRKTSKKVGKIASKVLRNKTSSKANKTIAGSVLSQRALQKKNSKKRNN